MVRTAFAQQDGPLPGPREGAIVLWTPWSRYCSRAASTQRRVQFRRRPIREGGPSRPEPTSAESFARE